MRTLSLLTISFVLVALPVLADSAVDKALADPAAARLAKPTPGKAKIASATRLFNGVEMPAEDCVVTGDNITVRQTQQVTAQTTTELTCEFAPGASAGEARIRMISER